MGKTLMLVCLFFLSLCSAFGQTTTQLRETYGPPIEAYTVSEHIWMTPEFTEDGQVCAMRLYPKRISATTNYLGQDKLNNWELRRVLEQLAPADTRGNETKSSGLTMLLGQVSESIRSYENLSITFLASLHFVPEKDVATTRLDETVPPAVTKKPDDELKVPHDAEIVSITWTARPCPKR